MDRKTFCQNLEAIPVVETTSRFVPNPNILKFYDAKKASESGGYLVKVRLLPPTKKSTKIMLPATNTHTWGSGKNFRTSRCTGDKFRCPICRENWEHHQNNDPCDKDVSMMKTSHYTNCYVISNPADPTSEGHVKIIRLPATVYSLYEQATTGDRKKEFGLQRIFSLDDDGFTLVIKVVTKNDRTSYDTSYFMSSDASKDDVAHLTEEQKDRIWDGIFEITEELANEFKPVTDAEIIEFYVSQYVIPRNITPRTEEVIKVWKEKGVSKAPKESVEDISEDPPVENLTRADVKKVNEAVSKASSDIDDILN